MSMAPVFYTMEKSCPAGGDKTDGEGRQRKSQAGPSPHPPTLLPTTTSIHKAQHNQLQLPWPWVFILKAALKKKKRILNRAELSMGLQPNEVFPSLESSAPHTVAGLPPAPLTQSILDPRAPDPDGGHKAATRGFCFCSTFFFFGLGSPPIPPNIR